MTKSITLFALLVATITTPPVWGMNPLMSVELTKSEMGKYQASISAAATQTPSPATACDSATSRDRMSQNTLPGPEMGGILSIEDWNFINAEVESLRADIQANMTRFNGERLLSGGNMPSDIGRENIVRRPREVKEPFHVDGILPLITPVDQGTIKSSDTDTTLEITGNGLFPIKTPARGRNNIDHKAALLGCLEAQQAFIRVEEEFKRDEKIRQTMNDLLDVPLKLLQGNTPENQTFIARLQMDIVLSDLTLNPPQLRHIVPPEK